MGLLVRKVLRALPEPSAPKVTEAKRARRATLERRAFQAWKALRVQRELLARQGSTVFPAQAGSRQW